VLHNDTFSERLAIGCPMCLEGGHYRFNACPYPGEIESLEPNDPAQQLAGMCIDLDPCPVKDAIDPMNQAVFDFFADIETLNTLPIEGGLGNQPAAFIDGWRTYRHAQNECESKRTKPKGNSDG